MDSTTNKVLIAAGSGLAVGVALGILFAPAKGSETRIAIKDKAMDLTSAAKDKLQSVDPVSVIENLKSTVQAEFQEGKEETKAHLLSKIEALESVIEAA